MPPPRRTPGSRRPRVAGLHRPGRHGDEQRADEATDLGVEPETTAGAEVVAPSDSAANGVASNDRPTNDDDRAASDDAASTELTSTGSASDAPADEATDAPADEATAERETADETTADETTADETTEREPVEPEPAVDSETVVGTTTRPASKPKARGLKPRPRPVARDTGAATATGDAGRVATGSDGDVASASRSSRVAVLVALAVLAVGAVVAAGIFRQQALEARDQVRGNGALVDVATTGQVSGQISDALQVLFSYDYARLDDNEQAARDVVTDDFAPDLTEQYADIRELAPQLQAVVVATVDEIAVSEIDGDRAVLLVYLTQQATRGQAPQNVAQTRLTVTAERVDDRWRIDNVDSL